MHAQFLTKNSRYLTGLQEKFEGKAQSLALSLFSHRNAVKLGKAEENFGAVKPQ